MFVNNTCPWWATAVRLVLFKQCLGTSSSLHAVCTVFWKKKYHNTKGNFCFMNTPFFLNRIESTIWTVRTFLAKQCDQAGKHGFGDKHFDGFKNFSLMISIVGHALTTLLIMI